MNNTFWLRNDLTFIRDAFQDNDSSNAFIPRLYNSYFSPKVMVLWLFSYQLSIHWFISENSANVHKLQQLSRKQTAAKVLPSGLCRPETIRLRTYCIIDYR